VSSQPQALVRQRCTCSSCTIRGLMGPAVITTLGVLFLLSELRHGPFSIGHTFPVLFIVIGAILLASAVAPNDGHIGATTVPTVPPIPPTPPTYSNPNPYPGPRS
jgi:hypothetical protein